MKFTYRLFLLFTGLWSGAWAQGNPPYVNIPTTQFPQPANLAAASYTKAATQIDLLPPSGPNAGFHFAAGSNLLNMSINTYPTYVNNNYTNPAAIPNYYSFNPSMEAAVTPGTPQVDNVGGFSYNIPIGCSPGTAGMEPKLSVAYNSNGGNSWLGLGFNLTGISVITRVPKTVLFDGLVSGVKFNSSDAFALDGSRLFLKSGTYGQSGATYRAEVENYYTITSQGSQGSGPSYFTVTTPDGISMEYGTVSTAKSVDVNNTDVLAWYINKVYDVYGNYMTYSYTNTNGELLINKIQYTGNGNTAPYNRIEFSYVDRTDNAPFYVAGKEFRNTHLLSGIACKDLSGQAVKKYFFEYQYQYRSILDKVTEVDAHGNQLNPTYFEWNDESLQWNWTFGSIITGATSNVIRASAADLNGDGREDVAVVRRTTDIRVELKVCVNPYSTNAFATLPGAPSNGVLLSSDPTMEIFSVYAFDEDDDDIDEVFYIIGHPSTPQSSNYDWQILKLKGSGVAPVFSVVQEQPLHTVTGNGFPMFHWMDPVFGTQMNVTSGYFYGKQDITGDGLNDVIMSDELQISVTPSNQQAAVSVPISNFTKMSLGDFNGDGVLDIFVARAVTAYIDCGNAANSSETTEFQVYSYNNSTYALDLIATVQVNTGISPYMTSWGVPCLNYKCMNVDKCTGFGDVNGDGKTDLFYVSYTNGSSSCTLHWILSNGSSFLTAAQNMLTLSVPIQSNGLEVNFSVADANNDGKADVLTTTYDQTYIGFSNYSYYTSLGTSIIDESIGGAPVYGRWFSTTGDFDGDGVMDFVFQDNATTSFILYHGFNEDRKKVVKRVFNIKDEIALNYEFLPSSGAGQKTSFIYNGGAANFKNVKPDLYIVTSMLENGQTFNFGYTNGILHRQGKGFIGFERIFKRSQDQQDMSGQGLGTYSGFLYDPNNDEPTWSESVNGYLSGSSIFTVDNTKISAYSSNQLTYNYANNSTFLRAPNTSVSISKDYLKSTYTRQTLQYNYNYGGKVSANTTENLTWQNVTINSKQVFTAFQALTHPINSSTYFRPQVVTEQITAGANSSQFQHLYTYNGQGQLTTEVKNSNTSLAVTTNYSQYTSFGRPQNIVVSASDIQPRTTQLQYDNTGRFVIQATDPAGQVEQFVYDFGLGNKTYYTDISGQLTKYQYDGLGRIVRLTLPTGVVGSWKYEWSSYSSYSALNSPYNGTAFGVKETKQASGAPTVVNYHDRNNNLLRTEKDGFNGNTEEANYTYNTLNKLLTAEEMHYSSQGTYNTASYAYDDYLRPSTLSKSLGNVSHYQYNALSTAGSYVKGFVTVAQDAPTGNSTYYIQRENNEAGRVDKVANYSNPQQSLTATYQFNQFGKPSTVSNNFAGTGQYNITMSYDMLGRQSAMNDPNMGSYTYAYNSVGEMKQEVSSNGTYNMQYDLLGRVTQKSDGTNVYTYSYETLANGRGHLKKIAGPTTVTEYQYDPFGRMTEKKETLSANSKVLQSDLTYDMYGQLINHTYPGGFVTTNQYDNIGNLIKIKNGNTVIWQLGGLAAPGVVDNYSYDNGVTGVYFSYDANFNLSDKTYGGLITEHYAIASNTGDLMERTFNNNIQTQDLFRYDEFDRLKEINYTYGNNNSQAIRTAMTYNNNGNLSMKSDCGNYVYSNSSMPYQLSQINSPVANNIDPNTLTMSYTGFGKVSQISRATNTGAKQYDFVYNNDEQRIKMTYQDAGNLQYTRYYADDYDLEESGNNQSREWSYIYAPTGLCAMYYKNGASGQLLYIATDNQESPVMLTDANGSVVEEYSFDPWGRKRNPADWNDYNVTSATNMIRGYTMHEMLDELGLINMNGRIYEPVLGRFLQPDNFVQTPDNLQNFDRYSYCMNNPVRYVDPTGYKHKFKDLKNALYNFFDSFFSSGPVKQHATVNTHEISEGFAEMTFEYATIQAKIDVVVLTVVLSVATAGIGDAIGVSGFIAGAAWGAGTGAAIGAIGGMGDAYIEGEDIGEGAKNGAILGAITGGLEGGLDGGLDALKEGGDFWTGKPTTNGDMMKGVMETVGLEGFNKTAILGMVKGAGAGAIAGVVEAAMEHKKLGETVVHDAIFEALMAGYASGYDGGKDADEAGKNYFTGKQ